MFMVVWPSGINVINYLFMKVILSLCLREVNYAVTFHVTLVLNGISIDECDALLRHLLE